MRCEARCIRNKRRAGTARGDAGMDVGVRNIVKALSKNKKQPHTNSFKDSFVQGFRVEANLLLEQISCKLVACVNV